MLDFSRKELGLEFDISHGKLIVESIFWTGFRLKLELIIIPLTRCSHQEQVWQKMEKVCVSNYSATLWHRCQSGETIKVFFCCTDSNLCRILSSSDVQVGSMSIDHKNQACQSRPELRITQQTAYHVTWLLIYPHYKYLLCLCLWCLSHKTLHNISNVFLQRRFICKIPLFLMHIRQWFPSFAQRFLPTVPPQPN